MAKTWLVRDLPSPKQLAPKSTPGSGQTYLAPAGTSGSKAGAAKPKAAPKMTKSNATSPLVDKTKTLEKSSAMY